MCNYNGYADLHLHTNRSDGHCSPRELIDKCVSHGLRAISIVDHDDISALNEAVEYGRQCGIEVIPGVELSVSFRMHDLHILGYAFDYRNAELVGYLDFFKKERVKRARTTVEKLAELGMPISFDAVLKEAGSGTVGRPHVAHVLLEEGYVHSFQEAFNRYLGDGKPGNVKKYKMEIDRALKLISQAGGVSSIAHPGLQLTHEDTLEIIKAGIDGIEVVHPRHNEEATSFFSNLASENGLLGTGGSDYHGSEKGDGVLGKYKVPYEAVTKLKEAASRQNHKSSFGHDAH